MNILALDFGTKCGWASFNGFFYTSGVWNLAPSKFDSKGELFRQFKQELSLKVLLNHINFIVYEEVMYHRTIYAAHIYGGFLAILQTFCLENKIEYKGVPVTTIKKSATGKGSHAKGKSKEQMILAANRLFPNVNIVDDNHADALCLLNYAEKNIIF